MARTASVSKGRASAPKARSRSKSPLARLLSNPAGRLLVLGLLLVTIYAIGHNYLSNVAYPYLRDSVLHAVGYGVFTMTGWVLAFLLFGRFKSEALGTHWRVWVASAFFIMAAQTVMGTVHGTEGVPALDTLGGLFGQWLWGGSAWSGVLKTAAFALTGVAFLAPAWTGRTAKRSLIVLGHVLWWMLRMSGKGIAQTARWSGRKTKELFIAIGNRGSRNETDEDMEPLDDGIVVDLGPDASGTREIVKPSLLAKGKALVKAVPLPGKKRKGTGRADDEPELPPEYRVPNLTGTSVLNAATGDHPPLDDDPEAAEHADKTLGAVTTPTPARRPWMLPPMPLLEYGPKVDITKDEISDTAQQIEDTLKSHGIEVEVNQIKPGPTVTLYGLTPGWVRKTKEVKERDEQGNLVRDDKGRTVTKRKKEQTRVRVDAIVAREKDLALALAAPSLRIQAPVPGESIVGIEVPNRNPVFVSLRGVLESAQVKEMNKKGGLALALGQGSGGEPVVTNLRKLPHLLVAGATGSGKSVCLNTIIVSLVTQISPERLRLILIDPKRVELTPYNGLPHLVRPVIVDTEDAVAALKGLLREMFRRYKLMEAMGVRNIDAYLAHPDQPELLPYLVVAVDELADLMMSDTYNVERTLTRLAQLGRATGIHLVVATQRPSVDVVTGLIKANFPSRISFAVVSQVDSRTILDGAGAEKLLGKGDMLFLSTDTPKPQRVQGAYLSDREIQRIMDFWHNQAGPPLPVINLEPEPGDVGTVEDDEGASARDTFPAPRKGGNSGEDLMAKAIELAGRHSQISTSLLQRRLGIGYPRAARLMDQLEDQGILGPGAPGKPREVYLPKHEGDGGPATAMPPPAPAPPPGGPPF